MCIHVLSHQCLVVCQQKYIRCVFDDDYGIISLTSLKNYVVGAH